MATESEIRMRRKMENRSEVHSFYDAQETRYTNRKTTATETMNMAIDAGFPIIPEKGGKS